MVQSPLDTVPQNLESRADSRSYFATSLEHILAELERVDLLIQMQVAYARQVQPIHDPYQGLYISEQEVDTLLTKPIGQPRWATVPAPYALAEVRTTLEQMAKTIAMRRSESSKHGIELRLDELATRLHLTPFDIDTILICLAPELDSGYERLYAYLQNDVARKQPSVALVLNLLCSSLEEKVAARERFSATAPLLRYHLISLDNQPTSLLSQSLRLDARIAGYLLGADELNPSLLPYAQLKAPESLLENLLLPIALKQRLTLLARSETLTGQQLIFYFQGPYGVGKQATAEAFCQQLGKNLLVVEGQQLLTAKEVDFAQAVRMVVRETLLQNRVLYWKDFDALVTEEKQMQLRLLLQELEGHSDLTFLAGNAIWEPADTLYQTTFMRIEFPSSRYAERVQLWSLFLNKVTSRATDIDLKTLANQFRFSGGQIRDAAATAANLARWRDPEQGRLTMADLYTACRLQSNHKLSALAQTIQPHYTWNDIILPSALLKQLREVCNFVKYRAQVYDEWGFERKLALGKGLNVLFTGHSGTGKTMAAEIIANELGLDLYKIDLSAVISKYIGETEKNLAHIFAEAETANAILFFDEADALFGKRSEVKDAHDRYANIETSYLLQRMERYEGIAILATNLRRNMDDAFVRRMAFTVPFPFPEEVDRLRIWRQIWPPETPLGEDLDLVFMAQRFKLAGGNIKNIALAAAFLAAEDREAVSMKHVIRATRREFQKMGKACVEADFGAFYPLVEDQ